MENIEKPSRIMSVDFVRVIAIFFVIIIHTGPFIDRSLPRGEIMDLGMILNQLARFAVPCFFVLSGFFWASRFDTREAMNHITLKMAKRIALIYIVWSVVYIFPTNIVAALQLGSLGLVKVIHWNLINLYRSPVTAIFQGTKIHLWFLTSLLCCLVISNAVLAKRTASVLFVLSVTLYAIGLAGKAYADSPFGFHVAFNFRDGPFFGLISFVSGYLLQRQGAKKSWFLWGMVLTTVGIGMHFREVILLREWWGTINDQDYVIGTYFAGLGVSLIGLSNLRLPGAQVVGSLGPFVLGIYAVHFVFVDLLKPFCATFSGSIAWEIGYTVAVFVLSSATVFLMAKHRLLKTIVM